MRRNDGWHNGGLVERLLVELNYSWMFSRRCMAGGG